MGSSLARGYREAISQKGRIGKRRGKEEGFNRAMERGRKMELNI